MLTGDELLDQGDQKRLLANLINVGTITDVDLQQARCKVTLDDGVETDWMPWLAQRAMGVVSWSPLAVGEQVVVLAPSGDLAQGVVIPALYQQAAPPPSNDPNKVIINFSQALGIEADLVTGELTVKTSKITLETPEVSMPFGSITLPLGDVTASGISLKSHTHIGDSGGLTGPAQ